MPSLTRKNGTAYSLKNNKDRFFFPHEYQEFEDKLNNKQRHSVIVLLNTGCRIMEARHILVSDCDLRNHRIHVRVTKSKAKKGEKKGRGKTRIIPISTKFSRYLKNYIKDNNLTADDTLKLIGASSLDRGIKKAAKAAGLQHPADFSAHNLRKTLEVWLMSLGVGDLALTAHLGHDIRTAASHYVSPNIFNWKDKNGMRDIIGDLYSERR